MKDACGDGLKGGAPVARRPAAGPYAAAAVTIDPKKLRMLVRLRRATRLLCRFVALLH